MGPRRSHKFTLNYIGKSCNDSFFYTACHKLMNLMGMIVWPISKTVQMVPVGCISRSQGQIIGFYVKKRFLKCKYKNLLVRYYMYKAQSLHIWYILSSTGYLPKLFKQPSGSK